jgi:hypothetical protein
MIAGLQATMGHPRSWMTVFPLSAPRAPVNVAVIVAGSPNVNNDVGVVARRRGSSGRCPWYDEVLYRGEGDPGLFWTAPKNVFKPTRSCRATRPQRHLKA